MSEILDAISALGDATADMTVAKESFEAVRQDAEQAISDHLTEDNAHSQYVKTDTFEQVKKLPIYPEVMSDDNRLNMMLDNGYLIIEDDQIIRLYGWLEVNTSDYAVKSFPIAETKTYHLRFNLTDGFYLKDLSDVEYNPNLLEDYDTAFDTSYDDVLLAELKSGVLKVYKNVSEIPKGQFAVIETRDSYLLSTNGQEDLMNLTLNHDYARGLKVRVKTNCFLSSNTQGYGYWAFTLNQQTVFESERWHVGDEKLGYQFIKVGFFENEFLLNRQNYDVALTTQDVYLTTYFNCDWNWDKSDSNSFIKAELV